MSTLDGKEDWREGKVKEKEIKKCSRIVNDKEQKEANRKRRLVQEWL